MRRIRLAALSVAIFALLPSVALGVSQTVTIRGFAFAPSPASIAPGATITWQNADTVGHTATSDTGAFDTGPIASGGTSKTITFATAGTYAYHCAIHPSMHGTITVQAAPASSPPAATPTPTPLPTPSPTPTAPPTTAPPATSPASTPTALPTASAQLTSPSPVTSASLPPTAPPTGGPTIGLPLAAASPTTTATPGSAPRSIDSGPGPLLAAAAVGLAALLAGLAVVLYRRR